MASRVVARCRAPNLAATAQRGARAVAPRAARTAWESACPPPNGQGELNGQETGPPARRGSPSAYPRKGGPAGQQSAVDGQFGGEGGRE